jgi:hypothetical protein
MQHHRNPGPALFLGGFGLVAIPWGLVLGDWRIGWDVFLFLGLPGVLGLSLLGAWCMVLGLAIWLAPGPSRDQRHAPRRGPGRTRP